ncbi:MAG: enoyl-[acyl-carrier-protein] reductase FabK [Clostridiales bacterium]|nr:enoyl-[acyl-carrier-protein] reductase FabK [Clostridiales bacterium]
MIRTPVCDLFGIEFPIFQGGMAWVADAGLASAVSNAGGLGIVAAMNMPGEALREVIQQTRQLTDRPFAVNIMLMSPHVEEVAQVVAQERVPLVTTGAGTPEKYMAYWISCGIKVIPVVPSTAVARRVVRNGACAVIAEGCEAGGHVGELTTMALLPQICDAVEVPVIAAGGIGDGRGIAAAFMLGATGVQVGTRFVVCHESSAHTTFKQKVLSAGDIDTITTGRRLGHPVRALKNPFTRKFAKLEWDNAVSDAELEAYGSGALRLAVQQGDADRGCFMAGQIAALVNREQPAAEIIREMFSQAERILSEGTKWVV